MPSHPRERLIGVGQAWDFEEIRRLDALGFEEARVGEHFAAPWEPCPAPEPPIARAPPETRRIGHLLMISCDATDERASWVRNPRPLVDEVLPRCRPGGDARGATPGGHG